MQVLNQYERPASTVPNGAVTQQSKELPQYHTVKILLVDKSDACFIILLLGYAVRMYYRCADMCR